MSSKNPFSLSFGRIPPEYIARHSETEYIIDTFTQQPVTDQTFLITGVRGSGKTVTMTAIGQAMQELKNWTVIKISPMEDILTSLLASLTNNNMIRKWCIDARIEISLPFVDITVQPQKEIPPSTIEAIDQILAVLQKHDQNVLILIDEITDSTQMQQFSSALQLFLTNNRPIYFIGTCLFEEIDALRNVKNLTFLYRAPKIRLTPLNVAAMAMNYQNVFSITKKQAIEMAKFTKGYSYAFQVLGFYCWQFNDVKFPDKKIINAFDVQLAEASYNKLWSDLSATDQKVMRAIAAAEGKRTKDIYQSINMSGNMFNQYRRRLMEHGLLDVSQYGRISFALPRLAEYIKDYAI